MSQKFLSKIRSIEACKHVLFKYEYVTGWIPGEPSWHTTEDPFFRNLKVRFQWRGAYSAIWGFTISFGTANLVAMQEVQCMSKQPELQLGETFELMKTHIKTHQRLVFLCSDQGKGRLNAAKYSCIKCWEGAGQLKFYLFFFSVFFSILLVPAVWRLCLLQILWIWDSLGRGTWRCHPAGLIACCADKRGFLPHSQMCFPSSLPSFFLFIGSETHLLPGYAHYQPNIAWISFLPLSLFFGRFSG